MAKRYQVKEMAKLSGVSVRTLHHYDRIGLLTPRGRTEKGYRLYGDEELIRLQQILIYRELGMSLEQIANVIKSEGHDVYAALLKQRALVQARLGEAQAMLRSIDRAIARLDTKGAALNPEEDIEMSEIFEGFQPEKYEEETEARWGKTDAFGESKKRTAHYDEETWRAIKGELDTLLQNFAEQMNQGAPQGDEAVCGLVEQHRLHIDRWFYPCSHAMHASLAEMYVADERFAATFEKHGEGLAEFVSEAIRLAVREN